MEGLIDKAAEKERVERELKKLRNDLSLSEGKLANENFVSRAPADVVAKERSRVDELRASIAKLEEQLGRL